MPEPGEFIKLLLQKGFVHVCGHAGAGMQPLVRLGCRQAVEGLWRRHRALVRLAQRSPRLLQQDGNSPRQPQLDNATLVLHQAASKAARALLDRADADWRDLEPAAHAEGATRALWPPTPSLYAQAIRCTIEYATDDSELRLALMEIAIAIAVPEYVTLCTRVLMAKQVLLRAPLPHGAATTAQVGAEAAPLADVLPGQWFRMVLHQQWTEAQLTWRSPNGRFFMFSSPLAGRAHSLSRPALEGLIQRGHFEKRRAA